MKLEDQVTSLELSKKLKKLGVKQKSLWWWVSVRKGEPELFVESQLGILECNSTHAYKRICSAFTVAELGEMLFENRFTFYQLGSWWCFEDIRAFERGEKYKAIEANTEANARAKMLIYLKVRK